MPFLSSLPKGASLLDLFKAFPMPTPYSPLGRMKLHWITRWPSLGYATS